MSGGNIQPKYPHRENAILSFYNVNSFTIPLERTPSTSAFGCVLVINANQDILSSIYYGQEGATVRKYGTADITATISGQNMIVSRTNSATMWGITICIISANYELTYGIC